MIGKAQTNPVPPAGTKPRGSTGETLDQISQVGEVLQRWLPTAELTNCTIQFASSVLAISHADWRAGGLRAAVRIPATRGELELTVAVQNDAALQFAADWDAYNATLRGEFSRNAKGWNGGGQLGWLTNRAEFAAQFTTNGWWPAQGQIDFPKWRIPAKLLQVAGYEHLVANLKASIVSNHFDFRATGFARPAAGAAQRGWPDLNYSLGADGDFTGVNLHSLNIHSPWLNADLTNTVGVTWTGQLRAEPAQLHVSVDLAKIPGVAFTGKMEGTVRIEPQPEQAPVAQFRLTADHVHIGKLDASKILVRGEFTKPLLKLEEIRAELADGSTCSANASFDAATRHITAGNWKLSGGWLRKFLPNVDYEEMTASGEMRGPVTNLTHSGEAAFTAFETAGVKPLNVRAQWRGENWQLESVAAELNAGESVLTIGGAAGFEVAKREVTTKLNQFSLRHQQQEIYALQAPCLITFTAGNTNTSGGNWGLWVDAFNWRSERHSLAGAVNLAWPALGIVALTMTNVAGADFSDFLKADVANILVTGLNATAQWSNGPVQAVISTVARITNHTDEVFDLAGTVQADDFLTVELAARASGYPPTLSVTGAIPLKVFPERGKKMFVWDRAREFALKGNWRDEQAGEISTPLGALGELEIANPRINFLISGTAEAPTASLTAKATRLSWQSRTNAALRPRLEDFNLTLDVRPETIRLPTFSAKLDGQLVTATGTWPLPKEFWRELWATGKLPDWDQAEGHLELADAQIAAVSAYLPEVLAPEGRLTATVGLKSGKRLEGALTLTNAATRSMGTITPLRDIAVAVRFDGRRAVLETFHAQIGGQPIRGEGFVVVPQSGGDGLDYHINLSGTNVPVARNPELLLRGDFAVSLRGGSNQPPSLTGTVTLRDGLYVQNASALVWSAPRRPEWRPPYFSITNEPFADWKLDLAINGDRFLRLRTPVFSGIASANFQLNGSLLTPMLTGDARINSGRLIFPFGSLTIDQGLASFSGNDARGPELLINASGRNYSYDLRLEVKGPADGANVIFSSTPPLASEEILLMLTAGEIPQSDYTYSNVSRAGRLATFLGQDLLSRYLGSDPGKERLIIQTGEGISQEGRLTYSIEYRLTDRWSIIGEYDEFNAFNTDLKWKVFTR